MVGVGVKKYDSKGYFIYLKKMKSGTKGYFGYRVNMDGELIPPGSR